MIEWILAIVLTGATAYGVARHRHKCNHEWEDREWLDEEWSLSTRTTSQIHDSIHPQHRLRRGIEQECSRCGSTRVDMREVVMWSAHASDEIQHVLQEEGDFR